MPAQVPKEGESAELGGAGRRQQASQGAFHFDVPPSHQGVSCGLPDSPILFVMVDGCEDGITFEVSDGVVPMQLHRADTPKLINGMLQVALSPRIASCKPRDRWLEEQKASACCSTA